MTELKTLKDLNEEFRKDNIPQRLSGDEFNDYWEDKIKAEAVKWVKWINSEDGGGMCHTCDELWNDFFNITEEDLK